SPPGERRNLREVVQRGYLLEGVHEQMDVIHLPKDNPRIAADRTLTATMPTAYGAAVSRARRAGRGLPRLPLAQLEPGREWARLWAESGRAPARAPISAHLLAHPQTV